MNELITYLPTPPDPDSIPAVMPSPFADSPHPLAELAARQLQQRLGSEIKLPYDPFAPGGGKMFGVLLVRDGNGHIGYLSAFSAMIGGSWQHPGFVPQLFDAGCGELFSNNRRLAELSDSIETLAQSTHYHHLQRQLESLSRQRDLELGELRDRHLAARAGRRAERRALQQLEDSGERDRRMAELALASQHQKREATNAASRWQAQLNPIEQQLAQLERQIDDLKRARTEHSRELHARLFASYRLRNALGEEQPITRFFPDATPPAGAGDCAGPKLLQYAHRHTLQPLAMAEFWWGASPASGVRRHGSFYPACRGKCRPILPFMLRGLDVAPEPHYAVSIPDDQPRTIYEDDCMLLIDKPAGLLSEPGRSISDSVLTRLRRRYPEHPELKLVHRLDMATSGLLLIAKSLRIHKQLQQQFIRRTVGKRYEALLAGRLPLQPGSGEIDLPLRVDLDDRPRQLVCFEHGKQAITRWQLIGHEGDATRVHFYPLTGRSHQLRMHASHRDGLDSPIVGDALYGEPAERLMLHAGQLHISHPVSKKAMVFELPAPF